MKFNFKDKKLRVAVIVIVIIAFTAAVFLLTSIVGKNDKLVEYGGIAFTKGSEESKFIEQYTTNADEFNWQSQRDVKKIDGDITKLIKSLSKALKSGKKEKVTGYFAEDKRETYEILLDWDTELKEALADHLLGMEMTFLAKEPEQGSTYYRTAEYSSIEDGVEIPVVFIFIDGEWYIDSL